MEPRDLTKLDKSSEFDDFTLIVKLLLILNSIYTYNILFRKIYSCHPFHIKLAYETLGLWNLESRSFKKNSEQSKSYTGNPSIRSPDPIAKIEPNFFTTRNRMKSISMRLLTWQAPHPITRIKTIFIPS